MKKNIILVMLAVACSGMQLRAQEYSSAGVFKPANATPLRHRFLIPLSHGNQVIVELSTMQLLPELADLDSLLASCLHTMEQLPDSLNEGTDSWRVRFFTDVNDFTKIRVSRTLHPHSYALARREIMALKMEQDTLVFGRYYPPTAAHAPANSYGEWQVTVLVNSLDEIENYVGTLDTVIRKIAKEYAAATGWTPAKDTRLRIDATYNAFDSGGSPASRYKNQRNHFELTLLGKVSIQNVRNLFSPSLVLPGLVYAFTRNRVVYRFKIESEIFFVFGGPGTGSKEIATQNYITAGFSKSAADGRGGAGYWQQFLNTLSFGVLVKSDDPALQKNRFKLQVGGFTYKTLSLSPQFFFNGFARQVSPSLKLALAF